MKKILLTCSLVLTLSAINVNPAEAKKTTSAAAYTGYSKTEDSYYVYAGAVQAFNNNLHKDGFIAKVDLGYGNYDYSYIADGNKLNFDGELAGGGLMVGYQKYFSIGRATLYLGGNYENHEVRPDDDGNKVSGGQGGGKVQMDLFLTPYKKIVVNHGSSYSDTFNSYWSNTMIGWDFGAFTFGPEASFLGSQSFDQQRYGASFANIDIAGVAKMRLSGGGVNTSRRGDNTFYASIGFSSEF